MMRYLTKSIVASGIFFSTIYQMLKHLVIESLKSKNIFLAFEKQIGNLKKNCVTDIRRDALNKGDMWENFCVEYLKLNSYDDVTLLKNMDEAYLKELGLRKKDMGIDIIATKNRRNVAIQCKFRVKRAVNWRDIATFEALCSRSGPWCEHIVMTNASFVHREGINHKDVNIVKSTFEQMPRNEWCRLACYGEGEKVGGAEKDREKWLSKLEVGSNIL